MIKNARILIGTNKLIIDARTLQKINPIKKMGTK
jgi:hypothetical protein